MSAVIEIIKVTGDSPGTENIVTDISLLSADSHLSTLEDRIQSPIDIPSSGKSYSYETWVKFKLSAPPNNLCDDFRVWGPATPPVDGVIIWMRAADQYATPVIPTDTTGFTRQDENYYSEEHYLTISGYLSDTGDCTGHVVVTVEASTNTEPASMPQIDLYYSYREQ